MDDTNQIILSQSLWTVAVIFTVISRRDHTGQFETICVPCFNNNEERG